MFEFLRNENKNTFGNSLGQGKKFELMQNQVMKYDAMGCIEGFEQRPTLDNLDKSEMNYIQNQIDDNSAYQKLLSDCSSQVKLYNDELAKGKIDFDSAESLRNSMVQTCAMLDSSIQKFRSDISNLENQSNNLETNRAGNSALTLEQKLNNLGIWENKLDNTEGKDITLDGEIENNKLKTDSVYIKYFAWMFASVAMTSIVVHQLLKD